MSCSAAGGQDKTGDAKYLSLKLWTESDMTMIVPLGSCVVHAFSCSNIDAKRITATINRQ